MKTADGKFTMAPCHRVISSMDIGKSFMKNGATCETTEAAEKNSVSSKRPSHQRNKGTTRGM
jgi:hypothetical protein